MTTVTLAVVYQWPRRLLETGDLEIDHTIRIHLPFVPAHASIASYLLNPTGCQILFWEDRRRMYGKLDLARPINTLTSPSMQSLRGPILLLVPSAPSARQNPDPSAPYARVLMDDTHLQSDDIHLLPSSHTGDTPPRQPFAQRLENAGLPSMRVFGRASPHTPIASPNSSMFPDLPSPHEEAAEELRAEESLSDADEGPLFGIDADEFFELSTRGGPAMMARRLTMSEEMGIFVNENGNATIWRVVLERADKEAVFIQFFERFCSHLELAADPLPCAASNIKIHVIYVGETGVGDGLVVEMLSYIWKHLFENTHHFVRTDKTVQGGYYIPSGHPDTCLLMGHFGLLASVSLSYAVRPHDLHPMFLRRTDKTKDYHGDAMLYDAHTCGFVPVSYAIFDANRQELQQYWNEEHDFDRRVMPLARVTSEAVLEQVIIPEMYKTVIFPTALAKRNLDVFRYYLFGYAERDMNGLSPEMIEKFATVATFETSSAKALIRLFHLSPEDQQDSVVRAHMRTFKSILTGYATERVAKLMQYVTNKSYPSPILVRFRSSTYIFTCTSILQLRNEDKESMAEELDVILAVDLPNMSYHDE